MSKTDTALKFFPANNTTITKIFDEPDSITVKGLLESKLGLAIDMLLQVLTTAAVIAIIYAGILYIYSVTNEEYRAKANKVLLHTFAGILVATLALGTMNFINNNLKSFVSEATKVEAPE